MNDWIESKDDKILQEDLDAIAKKDLPLDRKSVV